MPVLIPGLKVETDTYLHVSTQLRWEGVKGVFTSEDTLQRVTSQTQRFKPSQSSTLVAQF